MASTWYRAGTISLTNGSTTVTGSGTQFVSANIRVGDALHAPDGKSYEISSVVSATELTLRTSYLGATTSGADYSIQPTRGILQSLYEQISTLTSSVQIKLDGVLAGLFPNGEIDAPSQSFASQTDQGRYINSSGNMADVRGSEEYVEFTDTGLVINKPITGAAVTQSPTDHTEGRLVKIGDSPEFTGLTVDTDTLYVDSANNRVGIGTSSPEYQLHVVNPSGNSLLNIEASDASSFSSLFFSDTTNAVGRFEYNHDGDYLRTVVNNSEAMRIDSSGNVGIGTSSPVGQLDVRGGNIFTSEAYSFTSNSSTPSAQAAIYRPAANTLGFSTAASEAMRIDSSGRVGIGTSSPSSILHVSGTDEVITQHTNNTSGNVQQHISLRRGDGSGIDGRINSVGDGSNGVSAIAFAVDGEVMRIDSSGNVGIGTSSPDTHLEVNNQSASASDNQIRFRQSSYTSRYGELNFSSSREAIILGTYNTATPWPIVFDIDNSEAMRIDSSGNVGIGTSSPDEALEVSGGASVSGDFTAGTLRPLTADSAAAPSLLIYNEVDTGFFRAETNAIGVSTGGSEAMRIDGSGNVLVGKTVTNANTTDGVWLSPDGRGYFTTTNNFVGYFNRRTTRGEIVRFEFNGASAGKIDNSNGYINLISSVNGVGVLNNFFPIDNSGNISDNAMSCGIASGRWDSIYAVNGTILTSDRNEKQDIEELTEAERRVAVAAKSLLRKYRWKDSVAKKGDDARIHFGIIAQDLQAAFEAEGLDAGRYAMFIHSEWTDEKTGEQRSRMGVRYSELLAFIIAAI